MRLIVLSFARGFEKRPWRGGLAQAVPFSRRVSASAPSRWRARSRRVEYHLAPDAIGETPAVGTTSPRQGVSGSIWVGAKPSQASDRFEGRHADGVTSSCAAPGPIPPGWPRLRKERGATREKKLHTRATGSAVRGVRTIRGRARRSLQDCRSRRAARGLNQPWREERLGKPWSRSSPPARERREGEAAPEAGARRQSRAIGGGLGDLERDSRALGDGRRSEPGKPLALTRGWWKRFWFLEEGVGREPGTYVGARQGVSEVSFVGLARGRKHRGGHGSPVNWAAQQLFSTGIGGSRSKGPKLC